ncbi:hypothetical protein K1719_019486 [Acacia pycnantha]|nr:hypothetical protein K1719_019486 [Acacia pycnantha]
MSDHPQHYYPSPALSLSLAGIFRRDDGASNAEVVEAGEEASGGGGRRDNATTTVHEISSENSGLMGRSSRSDDGLFDEEAEPEGGDDVEGDDGGNNKNKKKRKRYHRHTAEQIREMEALFKESPHPDEKQRQQLGKQLGLAPRQVKFWFQNRRTQIKAIQERHENLLLKSEIDKLREENEALRGIINKACCPNCGVPTISSSDASMPPEEHQLRVENAKLKSEIEKLRRAVGKSPLGMTTTSPSNSLGNEQGMENRSCMEIYSGIFGLEKTRIMELVNKAMEELIKMATIQEPLWVRSVETGRQILNYDEYVKEFNVELSSSSSKRYSIEASRETGVVFLDLPRILQIFLDVNQWKEMFPSLISKAAIVDVICNGEGANRDGTVQLMFSEVQMVTPMVGSREVYFVRYCKQLKEEEWAIVDVSIENNVQDTIEASLLKCRKRPSGCIIQDTNNGHCKVTWVEHIECEKSTIQTMYRSIVKSGLAFGARRWLGTLQQQCQRLVFVMATNVPMKESMGVGTVAGRKSVMRLAQRMSKSFCHAVGASSLHTWSKYSGENGLDIRVSSRKNLSDRGEPLGLILCAVSCASLPLSPRLLVDFLRDEARRSQWQVTTGGEHVRSFVNLAKGKDRGNAVTIMEVKSKDESNCTWILQDSSTSTYESTVVYAPVDITRMQSVIAGRDSSDVPILPSGFSVIPDGLDAIRPLMITSPSSMHGEGEEEEEKNTEGESLLTIAFQVLVSTCPSDKLTHESLESVSSVMACTLRNIKTSLQCEDS